MEEKKGGFRQGVKNAGKWIARGVTNLIDGKAFNEGNITFNDVITGNSEATTKPTLNDYASVSSNGINIVSDITSSKSTTGSNDALGQTDIDLDKGSLFESDLIGKDVTGSIIDKVDIASKDKTMQSIADAENQNSGESSKNFFLSLWESINNWGDNQILNSEAQAREEILGVAYDPESKNITRLVINKPHGLLQDTADAFFSRGKNNEQIFSELYADYVNYYNDVANNSNYDDVTKYKLIWDKKEEFRKNVNNYGLIKAMEDDAYSDGLLFVANKGEAKRFGRRKDQFTQEQLDNLAQNAGKIKEGVYRVNEDEFDAFLEVYEKNNETFSKYSKDDENKYKVRVNLDEAAWAEVAAAQQKKILNPSLELLNSMVDSGRLTPDKKNELYNNAIGVVSSAVGQMNLYMESPLAYYKVVKEKQSSGQTLTEGEKKILSYGPGLEKMMNDYTSALEERLYQSIDKGVVDGEMKNSLDTIEGQSIKDFFKNSIYDGFIQSGGNTLYATESAIDGFQHINNKINYLFWQGKGDLGRRARREFERGLGRVGYVAGETASTLISTGVAGIENIAGTGNKLSDYISADFTNGMMLTTDEGDWGRLVKNYGLKGLENIPELGGELALIFGTGGTSGVAKAPALLTRGASYLGKITRLKNVVNGAAKTAGRAGNIGGKAWITKVSDGISDIVSPRWKAIIGLGKRGTQRFLRDQTIDGLASYYDTESYSTPSYLLSVGLSGITELGFDTILRDAQVWKMIKNKVRGLDANTGTGWKVMKMITDSPEIGKRIEDLYGPNSLNFQTYKIIGSEGGLDEIEDILEMVYKEMAPEGQEAMNKFSKQVAVDKLNELNAIDWNSSYGRRLTQLINARGTNISDVRKYILGVPGEVKVGGFTSSILFKDGVEGLTQTRYLKQGYDITLDNADGQFRSKLQNGFTESDLHQVSARTGYKDVIKGGKVNSDYFIKDGDKYILNGEGAKYLGLDVAEYTEAMAKADALRHQAEQTKAFLDENIQAFANGKGLSPELIDSIAKSGTFEEMVKELEKVTCR